MVEQFGDIPGHFGDAGVAGVRGLPKTPQVRGDDPVTGLGEEGDLKLPGFAVGSQPVEEDEGVGSIGVEVKVMKVHEDVRTPCQTTQSQWGGFDFYTFCISL